jgi:hypothetical protein
MSQAAGYPREDGEITVLGPEIFTSSDGAVICWKGENYVRQGPPEVAVAEAPRHYYLSTSCLHAQHEYCRSEVGTNGETAWTKNPSSCKFCKAPCICVCHQA